MEFKPLYPDDDKAELKLEKIDENSVKFSFEVLPKYIGKLGITLATTIGGFNSGGQRVPIKMKKCLNKIVEQTSKSSDIIYKDVKGNVLKVMMSAGSDDITIATQFKEPERLKEKYEVKLSMNDVPSPIINELLKILE